MKNYNEDIRMLMRRDSASVQLTAFLFAALFGFVSGAAALQARTFILTAARCLIYTAELEANQYYGFNNMAEIGVSIVLTGMWLILVLIVWHRIGSAADMKGRLRACGVWSLGAAMVLAFFRLAQQLA